MEYKAIYNKGKELLATVGKMSNHDGIIIGGKYRLTNTNGFVTIECCQNGKWWFMNTSDIGVVANYLLKNDCVVSNIKKEVKPVDANSCPRCNGRGIVAGFEHVKGGTCFRCGGTGRK